MRARPGWEGGEEPQTPYRFTPDLLARIGRLVAGDTLETVQLGRPTSLPLYGHTIRWPDLTPLVDFAVHQTRVQALSLTDFVLPLAQDSTLLSDLQQRLTRLHSLALMLNGAPPRRHVAAFRNMRVLSLTSRDPTITTNIDYINNDTLRALSDRNPDLTALILDIEPTQVASAGGYPLRLPHLETLVLTTRSATASIEELEALQVSCPNLHGFSLLYGNTEVPHHRPCPDRAAAFLQTLHQTRPHWVVGGEGQIRCETQHETKRTDTGQPYAVKKTSLEHSGRSVLVGWLQTVDRRDHQWLEQHPHEKQRTLKQIQQWGDHLVERNDILFEQGVQRQLEIERQLLHLGHTGELDLRRGGVRVFERLPPWVKRGWLVGLKQRLLALEPVTIWLAESSSRPPVSAVQFEWQQGHRKTVLHVWIESSVPVHSRLAQHLRHAAARICVRLVQRLRLDVPMQLHVVPALQRPPVLF